MSSDFEIIEGLKKNTKTYVHDGYIYTKNNSDALKTRLRCRDWKVGCKFASTPSPVSPFSKMSSTISKRRRIVLPKLPKTINEFDGALKTDERNVNDKSYRGFGTAGQEFALIFFLDTEFDVIKKYKMGI